MTRENTVVFRDRLFEAEEKAGLGLFQLTNEKICVYRQGKCLFIGLYEEAASYIFREAGVDDREIFNNISANKITDYTLQKNVETRQYQPFLNLFDTAWVEVRDGNPLALDLFRRHYSKLVYKDGRDPKRFVGPGFRMVLLSTCGRALFVWKKFISKDGQEGLNCSIFRNESENLSSWLIKEAMLLAAERWPEERRYFTYVNPRKIKSVNPGYSFKQAGWNYCGITKSRRLHILEFKK
jgi:hypothetical protein